MNALRPYQIAALGASKKKLAEGIKRQLLVLPTGTGKTVVFANLPTHHGFTKRVMVLVHREELAQQAADKIARWNPGYMVGVEMANSVSTPMDKVVVASVPTIGRLGNRRIEKFSPEEFDCLVCDEAHHSTANSYRNVFQHFGLLKIGDETFVPGESAPLLLGVTATPNRSDGTGLGEIYDDIVYDMPMLLAIRQGWLADICGVRVNTSTNLDSVKTRMGDFAVDQLADTVNNPERNYLIVQGWMKQAYQRPTVAFTANIQHALDLAKMFQSAGVKAEAVWGDDPDRREKLRKHRAGEITVLANCNVLTEGYDDWRIGCIILARPTKSQLLFTQMAGRGTRIPDGVNNLHEAQAAGIVCEKTDCILMDVVDATYRHSLVTTSLLFGMGANLDLEGKSASMAAGKLEAYAKQYPFTDFSHLTAISNLEEFAKKVDLFQVTYSAEVKDNSQFRWRSVGDEYLLTVGREDSVRIAKDLRDVYQIVGTVNGVVLDCSAHDLATASLNETERPI